MPCATIAPATISEGIKNAQAKDDAEKNRRKLVVVFRAKLLSRSQNEQRRRRQLAKSFKSSQNVQGVFARFVFQADEWTRLLTRWLFLWLDLNCNFFYLAG